MPVLDHKSSKNGAKGYWQYGNQYKYYYSNKSEESMAHAHAKLQAAAIHRSQAIAAAKSDYKKRVR